MRPPVLFVINAMLIIILMPLSVQVWGANCSSNSILLSTQEDVDTFQATYGVCDSVIGRLQIRDGDITDIDALVDLISVGESLIIVNNPLLTNIDGLFNLTNVGMDIAILNNPNLDDVDALINITRVEGGLAVTQNSKLTDVNGLANITSVVGNLNVGPNINIDGLGNIRSVGGSVTVRPEVLIDPFALFHLESIGQGLRLASGTGFTELNGLANLKTIGGQLEIRGIAALTHINGLSNLISAGSISIENNDALTNLDGLNGLTVVDGLLGIYSNENLINIDGLSSLNSTGGLGLFNNPVLSNIDGLASLTGITGSIGIGNNTSLSNLDGLVKLTNVAGEIYVAENAVLGQCSALAFVLGWPIGPPFDQIDGDIRIQPTNGSGCNSVQEILGSVIGPSSPSISASEAFVEQVTLSFMPAATTDDLWPITGYYAQCNSDEQSIFQDNTTRDIPDESSVVSTLIISEIPFSNAAALNISVDITHPRPRHLTLSLVSPSGASVMLWDEAVGEGENLVGTFPTTLVPAESLSIFDGLDFNGEWQLTIADGVTTQTGSLNSWGISIQDMVFATSEKSPVTITGLTGSQPYSCTVSAITGLGIGPASNTVSVMPTPNLLFSDGFEVD